MTQRVILLALVLTASLFAGTAQAAIIMFDLESVPATTGGGSTSLALTSGGLTMTITREGGTAFDAFQPFGFPASFGSRVLSPFASANDTAFLIELSQPTYFFGLDFGDIGPDADLITIQAFSQPGQVGLLTSMTVPYAGLNFPAVQTVSFAIPAGALSFRFIGGIDVATQRNTGYYDNFVLDTAQAVPEPASLALVAAGLVGVAFRKRHRR